MSLLQKVDFIIPETVVGSQIHEKSKGYGLPPQPVPVKTFAGFVISTEGRNLIVLQSEVSRM